MDMSSLFPSDAAAAVAGMNDQSSPHISFRAGILNRDPTTNQVTADPRPGTLQLITLPDDELMHFQWRPRSSSTSAPPASAEHDLIVLVGQTEFKQVTSCPSAARVYVLKWREEDTRLFFWMQEKDVAKDALNVATVNAILEHGPALAQQQQSSISTDEVPVPVSASCQPPQQQQQQQASSTNPASTNTTTPANSPAEGPLSEAALAQLRTLLAPDGGAASTITRQREIQLTTPTPLDLLSLDVVRPALSHPDVAAALPALLAEHAPPADRHPARLPDLLRSPALRAQAAAAASALTSGTATDLLRQFGLDAGTNDTEPLGARRLINALLAIQRQSNPNPASASHKQQQKQPPP